MNQFQQTLYDNLIKLCDNNEAFYYTDFQQDDITYRIFNYRLASYTDFLAPGALECRGHMFAIDSGDVYMACLPQSKFFNLNENPLTMNLDLSQIAAVEVKCDGSLISTYMHRGQLKLKSKGSLSSQQAQDAMDWLEKQPHYKKALYDCTNMGYTVNLEWVGPQNRIVLGYDQAKLLLLNIRDMKTGEYFYTTDMDKMQTVLDVSGVMYEQPINVDNYEMFVRNIHNMTGIEGFIVRLNDGTTFKVKTDEYIRLHCLVSDLRNPKYIFMCVINDNVDDILSIVDDKYIHDQILLTQSVVTQHYNHLVSRVENFYKINKDKDRKSYAIEAQLSNADIFSLLMSRFLLREVDYKAFMIKNYEIFRVH